MIALLFWGSVIAAVFDWRYVRKGGRKPTASDYRFLSAALLLVATGLATLWWLGASSYGLGQLLALMVSVILALWEFSRFRVHRAHPLHK